MACKLISDNVENKIPMRDLPGGKLAVIVKGSDIGKIVCKESGLDDFVVLGEQLAENDDSRSNGHCSDCDILIRVLEEGETIKVHYS